MKKPIIFFILMLVMASLAAAECLRLEDADNGKTNLVTAGAEIEITLKGNPTTGYSWDVVSFNTNRLQQAEKVQYRQTEQSGGKLRVGVGGQFVFRFKAIKPGRGDIKLLYRRSWETTAYDKVYSVILEVK